MKKHRKKCNCCGHILDCWDRNCKFELRTLAGYGSVYDGSTIRLRLCCDCFDKLVGHCKVSPIVKSIWH